MSVFIETERLFLRTWLEKDIEPFYQINQDPKVIEYLLGPLTRQEIQSYINSKNAQAESREYTIWAAELKASHDLIGFIGLNYTDWGANFTPMVEIGWRLGSQYWGRGLATEGASAVLKYGFKTIGLNEIVSFTVPENIRSLRVMEKIGLNYAFEFNHPKLLLDHRLSKHVLYRLSRGEYIKKNS